MNMSLFPLSMEPCPYCGSLCECDWVDVGVGVVQAGPYHCTNCGASQIGIYDEMYGRNDFTELEKKTGWYEPGRPPSPVANAICGVIVDHKTAKWAYDNGILDEKPKIVKKQ